MSELASFSTAERLRDGRRRLKIRALRRDDQADLVAAIRQTSPQSLYRRFFVPRRSFAPEELAFFVHVDFVDQVALVAVMDEGCRRAIVGGGPYIVDQVAVARLFLARVVHDCSTSPNGLFSRRSIIGRRRRSHLPGCGACVALHRNS